jgi:uncharacterized pyridoxamine 5'-phosphate oxidase family protein
MTAADLIAAFIAATPDFYFATVDANNRARVRPFGLALSYNGHLWFCSNSQKKVYAEIQNNPYIEVCSYNSKAGEWIRVSGKVVLADELAVKQKIFETAPGIAAIYQSPENPVFKVFYIEGQADFYSFSAPNSGAQKTVTLTSTFPLQYLIRKSYPTLQFQRASIVFASILRLTAFHRDSL